MQAYCLAFRRELLPKVGLMRETFRFYRNLDLDFVVWSDKLSRNIRYEVHV